jgi:hypothetical protein
LLWSFSLTHSLPFKTFKFFKGNKIEIQLIFLPFYDEFFDFRVITDKIEVFQL